MNHSEFTTSDTTLATAIVASGIPVEALKRKENGRVYFSFHPKERAEQITKRFWAKSLHVDAHTILAEYKTLKHRISNC